ncbi:hypothetical protein IQ26_04709 [Mesorhizobium tianshanense]|uniref:Uncharacterized protein n=1 Tax=Mesorhizobium tianshanense TaxID=39844 RepID=A0A562NF90_9HYPH|nr:hypothetical protein IQ26_04709 [Mesorhizobium tianshanense]
MVETRIIAGGRPSLAEVTNKHMRRKRPLSTAFNAVVSTYSKEEPIWKS